MPKAFDARHLSSNKNFQVQMTNWYYITISGFGDEITLATQSFTLPEIGNPAIELPYGNSKAKVAGQREFGDGSVTVSDLITQDTEAKVLEWQNQVQSFETGAQGWVSDYKRDMMVTQYGPDGTYERTWKYEGVWPSNVSYGELSGESSDKKAITITLSYDNVYRE